MRKQKQIVIDIDPEGNCKIDGQGFQGPECSHFLTEIEESLGQVTSREDKPEYRQRQVIKGRNTQRTGR